MSDKKLKYEFSQGEVQYLLQALNRVQIVGVQSAQSLVVMTQKLEKPVNASELEKETLEVLKSKYEGDKKDKKVN